jgi:hypothetical protein
MQGLNVELVSVVVFTNAFIEHHSFVSPYIRTMAISQIHSKSRKSSISGFCGPQAAFVLLPASA